MTGQWQGGVWCALAACLTVCGTGTVGTEAVQRMSSSAGWPAELETARRLGIGMLLGKTNATPNLTEGLAKLASGWSEEWPRACTGAWPARGQGGRRGGESSGLSSERSVAFCAVHFGCRSDARLPRQAPGGRRGAPRPCQAHHRAVYASRGAISAPECPAGAAPTPTLPRRTRRRWTTTGKLLRSPRARS